MKQYTVASIPGDGISPEVMTAVRHVLDAADANLHWSSTSPARVRSTKDSRSCPKLPLHRSLRSGAWLRARHRG